MSHELRTPLTSIRAFSEILLNDREMPEAKREEFLGVVVRESERLTRLVNQVLDMTRMDAGRVDWDFRPVDLVAVVDEAALTRAQASEWPRRFTACGTRSSVRGSPRARQG